MKQGGATMIEALHSVDFAQWVIVNVIGPMLYALTDSLIALILAIGLAFDC